MLTFDVLIIGSGLAGRTLALLLAEASFSRTGDQRNPCSMAAAIGHKAGSPLYSIRRLDCRTY